MKHCVTFLTEETHPAMAKFLVLTRAVVLYVLAAGARRHRCLNVYEYVYQVLPHTTKNCTRRTQHTEFERPLVTKLLSSFVTKCFLRFFITRRNQRCTQTRCYLLLYLIGTK